MPLQPRRAPSVAAAHASSDATGTDATRLPSPAAVTGSSAAALLLVGALGAAFVVRIWRRRRIRRERGVFTRALEMSVSPLSADGLARGAHQS